MPISRKELIRIKTQIKDGDVSGSIAYLEGRADLVDLETFREQKILFKVHNPTDQKKLSLAYGSAGRRLIHDEGRLSAFENFVQFATTASDFFVETVQLVKGPLQKIGMASLRDVLELTDQLMRESCLHFVEQHRLFVEQSAEGSKRAPAETSDLAEWSLHQMFGRTNDIMFAGANALNRSAVVVNSSRAVSAQPRRDKVGEALYELISIAANWNSLEYAVDMVSYGEWSVVHIEPNDGLDVTFGIVDVPLFHARSIGLRRSIISKTYGRDYLRPLRVFLNDFTLVITNHAAEFYKNLYSVALTFSDYEELHSRSLHLLDLLDIQDELLVSVAEEHKDVLPHYLIAIALRCFLGTGELVIRMAAGDGPATAACPRIPLDLVSQFVTREHDNPNSIMQLLDQHITSLPTSHFLNLHRKPFVKISKKEVMALPMFNSVAWPDFVRSSVIQGGPLGKKYGKAWENHLAELIGNYGWKVLQQGAKINKGGKTLTDIDLLTFKDDLLLIIQLKATAAGGLNTYENWKSRKILMQGAEQAKIAYTAFHDDSDLLMHLSSKEIARGIKYIQPLVITNSPLFSGWSSQDVPVLGIGSLTSILRGAKVNFLTKDRSVIDTVHYAESGNVSSKEFLGLIRTPLEWRIAKEGDEIAHHLVEIRNLRLNFPELERNEEILLE